MKDKAYQQNDIGSRFLDGSDLGEREEEVLADASERTGFVPDKLLSRSKWWGSSLYGAFHYGGSFDGKKAVLKIQGVKPAFSEIHMIESFAKVNRSKLVRPPHLYASLEWDDKRRYEALVMEEIDGPKLVSTPAAEPELDRFFQGFADYRQNCLNSPWIEKPTETISEAAVSSFGRWKKIRAKIYESHPLIKPDDEELIDSAVKVLAREYQGVEREFVHSHLSEADLYQQGNQIVIFSNLYWSWRPPLYDAVFGYHWFMYHLNDVDDITPHEVELQRNLWLERIHALPAAKENPRLLNLALLERATAGLNLDALSASPIKPITGYLVDQTRQRLIGLLKTLGSSR